MPVLHVPLSEEDLAKLEGEGDFAFFVAIPVNGQRKVVQVHLRHRKVYDLLRARAAVDDHGQGDDHASVLEGAWLEE